MTANTRLKIGLSFAIGGNLLFFTFWWLWMPWSASFKTALGAVLFFAPEAGTLICVAIIGKDAYEYFKNTLLKRWRKWRGKQEPEVVPDAEVKPDQRHPIAGASAASDGNTGTAPHVPSDVL